MNLIFFFYFLFQVLNKTKLENRTKNPIDWLIENSFYFFFFFPKTITKNRICFVEEVGGRERREEPNRDDATIAPRTWIFREPKMFL